MRLAPTEPFSHAVPTPVDGALLAERLRRKYADRISTHFALPARAGRYVPLPGDLPPGIARALKSRGIERLYSHQGEAWSAVHRKTSSREP